MPNIGRPPSDHKLIRFDSDCFEKTGEIVEEYYVVMSAPTYPKRFGTNRAAAEEYAKRVKRSVSVDRREVERRVKWF